MKNHAGEGTVRRNRNLFLGTGLFVFVTGLLLASCTDFYSTTWGEDFARDPSNIKVTTSNVNELLKDANGDTKASRAILEKLKGTTNPKLQVAAVKAANQAAGLTGLVLSNLDILTGDHNTDSLTTLGQTVMGEAKKNDIVGVANDIAGILPSPDDTLRFPEGSVIKSVSNSDLTLLLVTMMMAEATEFEKGFDDYAKDWNGTDKKIDGKGTVALKQKEKVVAAIANEMISRPDSELGKMLKDLVGA
jgi:hypothetical protein